MKYCFKIFFISIWPALSFFAHNSSGSPDLETLTLYTCILLIFLFSTYFILTPILKRHKSEARLPGVFLPGVILVFTYTPFKLFLSFLGPSTGFAFWITIAAAVLMVCWYFASYELYEKISNIFLIVLTFIPSLNISIYLIKQFNTKPLLGSNEIYVRSSALETPNIFYIIIDGYPRSDAYTKISGLKNSSFLNHLEKLNFYVADKSIANYPMTYLSLSSSLNMDYHLKAGDLPPATREPFYNTIQGNNSFVKFIKDLGYDYFHMGPGIWAGSECKQDPVFCINKNSNQSFLTMNETAQSFLEVTPILPIIKSLNKGPQNINSVRTIMNWLDLKETESKKPFFLFAHSFPPHPPYFYNDDCSERHQNEGDFVEWVKSDFLNQIPCINTDIIKLVEYLNINDPKAIIIIQSDHGPGLSKQFDKPSIDDWTQAELIERYGVFNALKLPERCQKSLYPSMSPVNNLRVVKSCVYDSKTGLLNDKSFYTNYEKHPDSKRVIDVTSRAQSGF